MCIEADVGETGTNVLTLYGVSNDNSNYIKSTHEDLHREDCREKRDTLVS